MPRKLVNSYIVGFVLSLALTFEAYLLVTSRAFSPGALIGILLSLAALQLLVQLFFFLHLDRAARAPWNIIMFLFMVLTALMVVVGSMWIMRNLDYRDLHPERTNRYIRQNEDL